MKKTETFRIILKPATATLIVTFLTVCGPGESPGTTAKKAGPYEATSKSLGKHNAPQWYNDAKFGIFIHWVPAFYGEQLDDLQ